MNIIKNPSNILSTFKSKNKTDIFNKLITYLKVIKQKNLPLVLLLNKIDDITAFDADEVKEILELDQISLEYDIKKLFIKF